MNQQFHPQQLSGLSQGDQPALPSSPKPPSVSHQCRFCGTEMRPNKSFCPNCGAQLAPVPQPPVQNPYAEARTQRAAEPTQFATPSGGQETPSLEIEFNHGGKSTYDLTKPVINIGRDPSNDIVIDTPVVSHFHAQIVREGNQLILVHPHPSQPHTTNGLLYQSRHILGNEPFRKPLVRGDIFRIGNEHSALVTITYNDGGGAPQESVPKIRPLPAGAPVSTSGSQSPHLQAQPQGKQQVQTRQHQPQPKKPRVMSTQVKVALIGLVGVIVAAIISGVFVLMTHGPAPITPTNGPTTHNGMTNYGKIYVVFNQNLPQPAVTPDNAPVSTNEAAQNAYAQDMQTLQFNASLQDNANPSVQWEESDTTAGNAGRSICGFYSQYYHAYDADSNNASYTFCLAQQTNFADFTYEVQMIAVQGYSGGVFFRSQNSQNSQFAYLFLIRSDGLCGLYVVLNTASGPYFKGLVGGTITSFNRGLDQTNTIAIVARGSQIDIYVNQVGIARVIDSTYSYGGVGVVAWTNSDIVFRNAKLWTA